MSAIGDLQSTHLQVVAKHGFLNFSFASGVICKWCHLQVVGDLKK